MWVSQHCPADERHRTGDRVGRWCHQTLKWTALTIYPAVETLGERLNVPVYFPSPHLSTDNAAMIAAAGHFYIEQGLHADLSMTADVTMRLQNFENEDANLKSRRVKYRL